MDASNKDYLLINDGIADLLPIYKANTDAEMYEAVNGFKNNYNKKRGLSQDYINVRIVHSVEGSYVEAIRDIQPAFAGGGASGCLTGRRVTKSIWVGILDKIY